MATSYPNGSIPFSSLVELDSGGGKHWTAPTSAAKWYALRAKVKREKGVTLEITPGWNAFRPLVEQYAARAWACNNGNCLAAAQPGSSSHGGTWSGPATGWQWADAMAFDVHNYWRVPWDYFKAACKAVGLLADGIPLSMSGGASERHHIIDLNPWGAIPAGLDAEEFTSEEDIKEKIMTGKLFRISYKGDDGDTSNGITLAGAGFWHKFTGEEYKQTESLYAGSEIIEMDAKANPAYKRKYDLWQSVCTGNRAEKGVDADVVRAIVDTAISTIPAAQGAEVDYEKIVDTFRDRLS